MMVPVASIVLVWQVLFNANGVVNDFLGLTGADKIDWTLDRVLNRGAHALPVEEPGLQHDTLHVLAGEHTAGAAGGGGRGGASEVYKFFAIKLRYLSPTVLFVTILSLINSFKVFREVYLLTGGYPYGGLYMLQHFMNNTFESLDYQKLSAAAVIMALAMVVIIAVLFKVEDWFGKDVEG